MYDVDPAYKQLEAKDKAALIDYNLALKEQLDAARKEIQYLRQVKAELQTEQNYWAKECHTVRWEFHDYREANKCKTCVEEERAERMKVYEQRVRDFEASEAGIKLALEMALEKL